MLRITAGLLNRPNFCAVLTFGMSLVLAFTITSQLDRASSVEDKTRANDIAVMQSHVIEHKIRQAMSASYALASYIKINHGQVADFEQFGNSLLSYHSGISAIYLAPNGITSQVVPTVWRDKGLGINLLTDPNKKAEVQLAKDNRQLSLSGPMPLSIGDNGIIGRLPVFLLDSQGNEQFWGLISIVIATPRLLQETELPELIKRGYQYELFRINPVNQQKQVIDRSAEFDGSHLIRNSIQLPNTEWVLDIEPLQNSGAGPFSLLRKEIAVVFCLMLAYLVKLLLTARLQKTHLKQTVESRTTELAVREADLNRAQAISKTGSWSLDLSSGQMEASTEARRIWGVSEQQRLSCNSLLAKVHPEDRQRVRQCWQQAIHGADIAYEYRLLINDTITWIHSQPEPLDHTFSSPGKRVGTIQDITERKKAEEDLRLAAIAFEGQEGMVITDSDRTILRVNKAFTRITGYSREEALGQKTSLLKSGMHTRNYYEDMSDQLERNGFWQGEIWNRRKNGEIYPEWLTITAVRSEDGQADHFVGTMLDITQRKDTEAKLEHLAYHDPLTGLANRRLLMDRLQHALVSNSRTQRHGALLYLDLDNFKTINDINGHGTGDQLLQQLAKRLLQTINGGDTIARIGGDEFAVIMEDLSEQIDESALEARALATRILDALKVPFYLNGHEYHASTSIGIDLFHAHSINADALLRQVEVAMYEAKANGGASLCFFDPHMLNMVTRRANMESDIRTALQQQQFVLYYQPQVNSAGKIIGAEALVRWQHPQKGMVSPAEFIPFAEASGLIIPLGNWVLKTACQKLRQWAEQPGYQHLSMAVNVSAKQFHQENFVQLVLEALNDTGADPHRLKLELTESILVDDVAKTITKMNLLKEKGVSFSLDDFGTGYSSLTYLKRLPLNQLKIDQSFVREILVNPNDAAITRTIIGLGKSLGLSVIAEGVETEAQKKFLQSQDCHTFQGYLFGRPSAELLLPGRPDDPEPANDAIPVQIRA